MNKTLKYVGLLAILPILAVALTTDYFADANAAKAKGVSTSSYGSANAGIVCGGVLCSEYPGGHAAFEASKGSSSNITEDPVTPEAAMAQKADSEEHEEKHEEKHVDEGDLDSVLRLARANVPATIPMHMGYFDGEPVYYIITDSSDEKHADIITEQQGWKVELAPLLKHSPDSALSKVYFFTNGVSGNGIHNYQNQVFASTPAQDNYSALTAHVHVTWIDDTNARELTSESEVLEAAENGEVDLADLPVILNMPQIIWPEGQMMVVDKTLEDDTPYGGGQVLDIDTDDMEVTFIAHRGWGPDGRTIYYIVTDATPSGPANMMGVVSAPSSANLIENAAAVDLFQFKNGIGGSGPLGFQPGIAAGAPGDANYSPMWRIFMIGWQNPDDAAVLETIGDINAYKAEGLIDIGIARPMDSDHIVNCPFIDPFQ